jgi:hypothetical protein
MESTIEEDQLVNKVLSDIKAHVEPWRKDCLQPKHIGLTRLSGLSNACYRVKINPDSEADEGQRNLLDAIEPKMLLYRVFECAIVNWKMENEIFKSLSDQNLGPKLYF